MANRRKFTPGLFVPLFILVMGFAPILNFASNPGFAIIRTVDMVKLIAAEMCFGAAVTGMAIFFWGNHSN